MARSREQGARVIITHHWFLLAVKKRKQPLLLVWCLYSKTQVIQTGTRIVSTRNSRNISSRAWKITHIFERIVNSSGYQGIKSEHEMEKFSSSFFRIMIQLIILYRTSQLVTKQANKEEIRKNLTISLCFVRASLIL